MFDWVIVWSIVLGLSIFTSMSFSLFLIFGSLILKDNGEEN
jgi:hypothetical protein